MSSASRGSNPRERRQQVNDIGARANGLLISMPAMLWAAAERGARGTVVAHGEPRTDRLFSVREVGGRGGRGRRVLGVLGVGPGSLRGVGRGGCSEPVCRVRVLPLNDLCEGPIAIDARENACAIR